ncbi:MAG: NAD-dependent epimerase/dehydratase family protein [Alphaproteobacteria bacterium]
MAQKVAFVTGATGFLGLNLVEQLCASGWQVTALHRSTSSLDTLRRFPVALAQSHLLDPDGLKRSIPENADCVFHVAGNTSVWSHNNGTQLRDNVDGTRNIVAAARAKGVRRFVHTSTWNVYGFDQGPLREDMPKRGQRSWINYARTKFYGEMVALAAGERGLPVVVLNPCHIVGRYDAHNWARMILMADRGKLPGIPPGSGEFCHAVEVARAHIAAAERGRPGENYLLGGAVASYADYVAEIGAQLGKKVPRRVLAPWLLRSYARVAAGIAGLTGREPDATPEGVALALAHGRTATDKAERELGYRKAPLATMVKDAVDWLRAEGKLKS